MEETTEARVAQRARTVEEADTAAAFGSEFPPAASTPWVLGLAEVACSDAIADLLSSGQLTVGIHATIDHVAPTPVGQVVTATATLVERNARRFVFDVEVRDENEVCARVRHVRASTPASAINDRLAQKEALR